MIPSGGIVVKRNASAIIILTLVVAVMIFAGVRSSRGPKVSPMLGNSKPLVYGEVKGKEAPDFVLHDLEGKQVKLSDFRGKAVLLNFWATWCGPCRVEMPWFVEMQKQYGPQGLEIIGVALDDSGKEAIPSVHTARRSSRKKWVLTTSSCRGMMLLGMPMARLAYPPPTSSTVPEKSSIPIRAW